MHSSLYLRIDPSTWEKQIRERFEVLKFDVWTQWLHSAAARIQSRLREDDGEDYDPES